jgi:RNA polymerase sigma-70 factor (ECF subfamily)
LKRAQSTAQPDSGPANDRLRAAIAENYEFVWRTLRRLGVAEQTVEDAAQNVLVVFSRRIDDVQQGAERAFMVATATRVAADLRKRQSRSREDLDPSALDARPSSSPSVEELIDQGRARDLLDVVLSEMPDDIRTVFIFFEFEQMTMASIAEMLDLPMGTVASRLRRARVKFETIATRLSQTRRSR